MKAILTSIRPRHSCNILNLIKLWEIRKKFPKDYVGWVYIYCTKSNKDFAINYGDRVCLTPTDDLSLLKEGITTLLNGKVVARFWCDKVEEFWNLDNIMLAETCLTKEELGDYLGFNKGYAIHITKLEIFDKPKKLGEFHWYRKQWVDCGMDCPPYVDEVKHYLTRAPQSWCYIEV